LKPRHSRMPRIASGWSMAARIPMRPPHRSHRRASTANTRRRSSDQGSLLSRGEAGSDARRCSMGAAGVSKLLPEAGDTEMRRDTPAPSRSAVTGCCAASPPVPDWVGRGSSAIAAWLKTPGCDRAGSHPATRRRAPGCRGSAPCGSGVAAPAPPVAPPDRGVRTRRG
jgi:hypothetical protein